MESKSSKEPTPSRGNYFSEASPDGGHRDDCPNFVSLEEDLFSSKENQVPQTSSNLWARLLDSLHKTTHTYVQSQLHSSSSFMFSGGYSHNVKGLLSRMATPAYPYRYAWKSMKPTFKTHGTHLICRLMKAHRLVLSFVEPSLPSS